MEWLNPPVFTTGSQDFLHRGQSGPAAGGDPHQRGAGYCGSRQRWTCRLLLSAPSSSRTIAVCRAEILRPVEGDSTLRRLKRHLAGFHFVGKVVLHPVFDLEMAVFEGDARRPAFWPDVSQPVRSAELERHKVVRFAHLQVAMVPAWRGHPVPTIRHMFLRFARLAVADAARPPGRIPEYIHCDFGIDSSRSAVRVWDWIAAANGC